MLSSYDRFLRRRSRGKRVKTVVIKNGATLGNTVAMVIQAGQWSSVSAAPGVDAAGNFQVQLRSSPGDVVIDINGYYGTTDTANNDLLVINGKNDSPGGVLVVNTTTTQPFSGAINAQNLARGTGVLLAEGGNAAIDVTGGALRVRGAGVGTNTFVTKHKVNTAGVFGSGGTLCGTGPSFNS